MIVYFKQFRDLRTIRGLWWEGGASSTDRLLIADLNGDEELLHGHCVHRGKVLLHQGLAILPFTTAQAEVLLKVDPELGDHDGVLQVSLHPLKTAEFGIYQGLAILPFTT